MASDSYPNRAELITEFLNSPVAAVARLEEWLAEFTQLSASEVYARLNHIWIAIQIAAERSPENARFVEQLSYEDGYSEFPGTTISLEEELLWLIDPDHSAESPNTESVLCLAKVVAEHRDYLLAMTAQNTPDLMEQGEKPRRLRGADKEKRDEAIRFLHNQGNYTQEDLGVIFSLSKSTINEILNPKS